MEEKDYRILCIDGGGSKGMYSIGVLSELEKALGNDIYKSFDLIYGTSTGAIIASMLALGIPVQKIKEYYLGLIPEIMGCFGSFRKSKKLSEKGADIFGELKFNAFKTDIGIIAMNYKTQEPLVFKTDVQRAHGSKGSFIPGFGVTILDAIEASAAACPIFCKKVLETENKGTVEAVDGGFIANNPTMFALIDAKHMLGLPDRQIKVLSIGVGNYVEKGMGLRHSIFSYFEVGKLFNRLLVASSNTIDVECRLLFPDIPIVRINETFNKPEYGTNMVERNPEKLKTMFQLGLRSFANFESDIKTRLNLS